MTVSPLLRRLAALGLLVAALALAGSLGTSLAASFIEGQHEIAGKQAQLRSLRDLAAARMAFEHLMPRKGAPAPVLPAEADAAAVLQGAVTQAAEGQQVIVDGTDALPPEAVTRSMVVHLRATQAGLYNFFRTVQDSTPYLLVPRLEITPARAADPEHGKPFVISADLRLAVLTAPVIQSRRRIPADPALP